MRVRRRSVYLGVVACLAINYSDPCSVVQAQSLPQLPATAAGVAQPTNSPAPEIVFSPKHSPRAISINPPVQSASASSSGALTQANTQPTLVKPLSNVMRVSHEQPIPAPTTVAPAPVAAGTPAPVVPAQTASVPMATGIPLQAMVPTASAGIQLSPLTPGSLIVSSTNRENTAATAARPAPTGAFALQPMTRGGDNAEVPPQHIAGLPFAVLPMARYDNSGKDMQAKSSLSVNQMTGPMSDPLSLFQQLKTQTPAPGPLASPQRTSDAYIPWSQSTYTWYTPVFAHHPLYFEQPNLERYGIGTYRWLQPAASSAHFFTSIGLMPYKVLTQHPREAVYTLGFDRPGNCAAYQGRPVLGQSSVGEVFKYWDSCSGYQ